MNAVNGYKKCKLPHFKSTNETRPRMAFTRELTMDNLQQLLGTDKRNPSFTICRNRDTDLLHVFYGGELFEKVSDDRNDPQFKLMVARLYNAAVNATKLTEAFGPARKTMRRWGHALKNGDPEELVRVVAARGWNRTTAPSLRRDGGL